MATQVPALLLLDIDGVLNPFAARSIPAGYVAHDLFGGEGPVLVNACHGDWIRQRPAPYVHIACVQHVVSPAAT